MSMEHGGLMTAKDVVKAVTSALNRDFGRLPLQLHNPTSAYITAVLAPEHGAIAINSTELAALGIRLRLSIHAMENP